MLKFSEQGKPALPSPMAITSILVGLCGKIRNLRRSMWALCLSSAVLNGAVTMIHFTGNDDGQICTPMSDFTCFNLQPEDMMALSAHLNELSEKHRQLEVRIAEEAARPLTDTVKLRRMKLEKLKLKDEIAKLSQTRH
jgi:hypothetical protein